MLAQAEFANNNSISQSIVRSLFSIVYNKTPMHVMDHVSLHPRAGSSATAFALANTYVDEF